MVAGVRHPKVALAVYGHTVGDVEFTGSFSFLSELKKELPLAVKLLDAMVLDVGDVYILTGPDGGPSW